MQKKIDLVWRGYAEIFRKDALKFVMRWHKPLDVHPSWIRTIEIAAADPVLFKHSFKNNFAKNYAEEPDLAAALLNFLREQWSKLEKSKAGKLKKFLATTSAVKWERSFGGKPFRRDQANPDSELMVTLWDLQDGEVATAFEHSSGGQPVTIDDVVKARRWAAKQQSDYEKFAPKVLDKDGVLHVKGKSRRRK